MWSDEQMKIFLERSEMLGLNIEVLETSDDSERSYIIKLSDGNGYLLIPSSVTDTKLMRYTSRKQVEHHKVPEWPEHLEKYRFKTLKVIGGTNLTSAKQMFYGLKAQKLDLTELDTSKVANMLSMFAMARIKEIDFGEFNTSNVIGMNAMFQDFDNGLNKLDLRCFNTSKVTSMHSMFGWATISELNLESFDTRSVDNFDSFSLGCGMSKVILSKHTERQPGLAQCITSDSPRIIIERI